jgi:hypothetical protein
MLTYLVPVLFTFYVKDVLKLKKIIPAPKGLEVSRHLYNPEDPLCCLQHAAGTTSSKAIAHNYILHHQTLLLQKFTPVVSFLWSSTLS